MLKEFLYADLERQFDLEGHPGKKASVGRVLKRLLHPRFLPLVLCRCARAAFLRRVPALPGIFTYLNIVLFGLEVSPRCQIGPGLFLPHTNGTVLGAYRIGANATIYQGVTLGAKTLDMGFSHELRPSIGDCVLIGAGAKVLGGIYIGDHVTVGANCVVLADVAPFQTVVGIPAHAIGTEALTN
ncbi:MAG TPA: DapH/DapD/GlmU-related protein [Terriglobales bacterium]|jgi:serine O-acetyltransferase|nr:DapH/DapD/GlmU-related protein [Terriglobales bacterium]